MGFFFVCFFAFTDMSSSCKQKPRGFGSDIHRLLLAAEDGQKADILAYSSGHLGPRSLNQSLPHNETKQPFWRMSQSQEETPNPLTLQLKQTKAVAYVKKKEMKDSLSEFTIGTALVESEVLGSRQDQATDRSSHADKKEDTSPPKIVHCSANSLPVNPRAPFEKKSHSYDQEGKQQFCSRHTGQVGLNKKDQLKTKLLCNKQGLWNFNSIRRVNVGEMHERKLQKVRSVTQTEIIQLVCLIALIRKSICYEMVILIYLLKTLANGA